MVNFLPKSIALKTNLILNRTFRPKVYNLCMIINVIYILIFLIFIFLIYLIFEAIKQGIENKNKKNK